MDKRKGNNYKFWHSPIALIVFFVVLILFGYKMIDLVKIEKETAHKKEIILEKIDNLRQRESDLSNYISKLETKEGQEEVIRENYQVAKPNEKMVIIVDEEQEDLSPKTEDEENGFIEWLKNIFKK